MYPNHIDFPPLERLIVDVGDTAPSENVERVVFLITKNHPERLRLTLPAIAASSDRLYVLDSSKESETQELCSNLKSSHMCYHGPKQQQRLLVERASFRQALQSGFITLLSDDTWDIWSKRNYALLMARANGFSRVFLIDDDVVPPPGLIGELLKLSDTHKLAGARVRGMPDVSVVGHLCALLGFTSQSFISGHFLAVNMPAAAEFYFADIYNEDWLFVLLNSLSTRAVRYGAIFQLYWNPYNGTEKRAISEEFGEMIIEGLARSMLAGAGDAPLDQLTYWNDIVRRRRLTLDAIGASPLLTTMPACLALLHSIRETASGITAEKCLNFWQTYQARLKEWRAHVELAAAEGVLP